MPAKGGEPNGSLVVVARDAGDSARLESGNAALLGVEQCRGPHWLSQPKNEGRTTRVQAIERTRGPRRGWFKPVRPLLVLRCKLPPGFAGLDCPSRSATGCRCRN